MTGDTTAALVQELEFSRACVFRASEFLDKDIPGRSSCGCSITAERGLCGGVDRWEVRR